MMSYSAFSYDRGNWQAVGMGTHIFKNSLPNLYLDSPVPMNVYVFPGECILQKI